MRSAKKDTAKRRYRYVMRVVETVESTTVIESDRRMKWHDLDKIAEQRRIKGELSLSGVTDVDSWCEAAYVDGKKKMKNRYEELP